MRQIVAVRDMDRRLPEQGRIRFGEKGSKGEPRKLTTFRFTSHDEAAIAEIAEHYGGVPSLWAEMPGQWQVTTTAKEIPIVLPPDALGDSPVYELWSGGGVQRRCDGEVCLVPRNTADGAEMVEEPCVCAAAQKMECKPKTRLTVILPEIRFGGGWRLESGGWNVAQELPGMVDMIASLQERGLLRAVLALEPRTSKFAGQTRKFVVPVLRPAISMDAILAGEGRVRALAPAPEPLLQLDPGAADDLIRQAHEIPDLGLDDEVIDAEIIEDRIEEIEEIHAIVPEEMQRKRKKMHALLKELGMGTTERHALVMRITNGRFSSSNDLDAGGLDLMIAALTAMKKAEAFFDGVDGSGMAIVSKR